MMSYLRKRSNIEKELRYIEYNNKIIDLLFNIYQYTNYDLFKNHYEKYNNNIRDFIKKVPLTVFPGYKEKPKYLLMNIDKTYNYIINQLQQALDNISRKDYNKYINTMVDLNEYVNNAIVEYLR